VSLGSERGSDRRRWGQYTFRGGEGVLLRPRYLSDAVDGEVLVLTTNTRRTVSCESSSGRSPGTDVIASQRWLPNVASDGQFRDEGAAGLEHAVYPYP